MNVQDWLTHARDRADAATEGPWVASLAGRGARVSEPSGYSLPGCFTCGQNEDGIYEPPDAAFIAAARTDLPAALDAIQAVLAEADAADVLAEQSERLSFDPTQRGLATAHRLAARGIRSVVATALGVSEP